MNNNEIFKITSYEQLFKLFETKNNFAESLTEFLIILQERDNNSNQDLAGTIFQDFNSPLDKFILNKNVGQYNQSYLAEFYLNFFKKLNENGKIFSTSYHQVNNFISQVKMFKERNFLVIPEELKIKVKETFPKINSFLLEAFIETFELLDYLRKDEYIIKYCNELILSGKKYEIVIKLIYIFSINENVDYNLMINTSLANKSKFDIIKQLCRLYTHKIDYIINYYLIMNDCKHAMVLAKDNVDKIKEGLIEEIALMAKTKELKFYYNKYMNYEIDVERLYDLYYDQQEMLNILAGMFCDDKLYEECYYILYKCRFKNINLKFSQMKNLKSHLYSNYYPSKNRNKTKNPDNKDMIELNLFSNDKNLLFEFKDYFGPFTENTLKIDLKYENIYVIENEKDFVFLDKFEKSKYIGIDLEWRPNEETDHANLIQLADDNFAVIIDYSRFYSDSNFEKKFCDTLQNKTFIGFGFTSDLKKIVGSIKEFMAKCQLIDITTLYKNKYLKQCPSLSELCKVSLNSELCKYEQMSNWNKRPLKMRQLHYAALDAHILLKLYKLFI